MRLEIPQEVGGGGKVCKRLLEVLQKIARGSTRDCYRFCKRLLEVQEKVARGSVSNHDY